MKNKLEKVVLITRQEKEYREISRELADAGILFETISIPEELSDAGLLEAGLSEDRLSEDRLSGGESAKPELTRQAAGWKIWECQDGKGLGKGIGKQGVLVLSDSAFVCKQLFRENIPVIGIQKVQNHEDFWGIPYVVESVNDTDVIYMERIYRRYRGIPWDILETERCVLREITTADVPRIAEIYKAPSVKKYMEPLYEPLEREVAYVEDYIKNIYGFYEYGTWLIVEKSSGAIIGRAGLENYGSECTDEADDQGENDNGECLDDIDIEEEKVELGYLLEDRYQQKGYATEVCLGILRYAKEQLGISTVWARIQENNHASRRFCEKLGFQNAGEKEDMIHYFKKLY